MKMTKRTRQVLDYLQAIGSTTNRKALVDLGINGGSFTKRVSELVAMGYPISKAWKSHPVTKDRYVEYAYDLSGDHPNFATCPDGGRVVLKVQRMMVFG